MSTFGFLLRLIQLAASLIALFRAHRERQAGRAEAVLEQREADNAAIRKAEEARARRRQLDSAPDGLRADDGFRRD